MLRLGISSKTLRHRLPQSPQPAKLHSRGIPLHRLDISATEYAQLKQSYKISRPGITWHSSSSINNTDLTLPKRGLSTTPINTEPKNSYIKSPHDTQIRKMLKWDPVNFRKIEELLASIYGQGNDKLLITTFRKILQECIQTQTVEAAEAAERFAFEWMIQFHEKGQLDKDPIEKPQFFGRVLQAYISSEHPSSGTRVENLLDKMEDVAHWQNAPVLVDAKKYYLAMKAYAIHGDVKNAKKIMERCRQAFEQGNERAKLDVYHWNTLLEAHCKSGKDDEGVEETLQEMKKSCTPNSYTYNTILDGCALAKQPQKAEFWLQEMYKEYKGGNDAAQPDATSFNHVMNAWTRTNTKEGAKQCEDILNRMLRLAKGAVLPVRPNTESYNLVIKGHANACQPQQAFSWLETMIKVHCRKPNELSFCLVLDALNTEDPNFGVQKTHIQKTMQRYGYTTVRPAVIPVRSQHHTHHPQKQPLAQAPMSPSPKPAVPTSDAGPAPPAPHELKRPMKSGQVANGSEGQTSHLEAKQMAQPTKKEPENFKKIWSATNQTNTKYDRQLVELAKKNPVNLQELEVKLMSIGFEKDATLNEKTFLFMLKACATSQSLEAAEAGEQIILERMIKLYKQGQLQGSLNIKCFGMVLQLWVKSRHPSAGKRAEGILNKMEDMARDGSLPFTIDRQIYNTVIKAYAINGDVENAQAVFDRCMHAFKKGDESARPNLFTWSTLLDACAKSGNPDAWKMAENIFAAMQKSQKYGILKDPPDTYTYNSFINACAKSQQPEMADFWLEEMHKDYQRGNASARPNAWSFSAVIDAWAIVGEADKASQVFDRMLNEYKNGNITAKPFTNQINTKYDRQLVELAKKTPVNFQELEVQLTSIGHEKDATLNEKTFLFMLKACATSQSLEAAEAGEQIILEWMIKLSKEGRLQGSLNIKCFGMVLQLWVKSRHPTAGKRAEDILNKMEDMVRDGSLPFTIERPIYNTVITAYAINGDVENAQAVFDRCMHAFKQGDESARPDLFTWSSLLDACAKSGNPDAWKMAENLFAAMQQSHKDGILKDPPDTITYNSIINACAKSQQPEMADFWLEEMHKDYQRGNASARPNARSFTAVIDAWAIVGEADKASQVFDRMLNEYKNGNITAKPNRVSCTSLLHAYSNAGLPNAGESADALLKRMEELQFTPDAATLTAVVFCWGCSLGHDHPEAPKRIQELQEAVMKLQLQEA